MQKPRVVDISAGAGSSSHGGHGSQFTRKMEQAVAALMTHRTLEEAAKAAGISVSTLKRWKATPEFRAAHLAARQESFSEICARLQQQCDGLGAVLLKAMATANPPSVRARAAVAIVRMGRRALTLETLEQRVAALESTQPERDLAPPTPRDAARQPSAGHGSQWPRKLEAAAAALMKHRKLEEAAREVGVAVSTLKRWKKLPKFQETWLALRREAVFQAGARLQQYMGTAVGVLGQIARDAEAPAGVQVRAAQCLLELAYEGLEQEDLERRIAALECSDRQAAPGRGQRAA